MHVIPALGTGTEVAARVFAQNLKYILRNLVNTLGAEHNPNGTAYTWLCHMNK